MGDTMSDSVLIEYAPGTSLNWIERFGARPIPWIYTSIFAVLALFRFVVGIADPGLLALRPVLPFIIAAPGLVPLFLLVAMHQIARTSTRRKRPELPRLSRSGWVALVVVICLITLHMSGLPLRAVFVLHRAKLNAAKDRVLAVTPVPRNLPASYSKHGDVGLFRFRTSALGSSGQISFVDGYHNGVAYSPDGEFPDVLFYPADDHGRLDSNWFWFTTD